MTAPPFAALAVFVFLLGLSRLEAAYTYASGDKIRCISSTLNVRTSAAGSLTGSPHSAGDTGTVVGSPTIASLSGTMYVWYNINWDGGTDGWSADKYGDDTAGFGNIAFTADRVAQLAYDANFRSVNLVKAIAIARAESNWAPNAIGTVTSADTGLWQVNIALHPTYSRQQMLNPALNASAAYSIGSNGSTWQPWATYYTTGFYNQSDYKGDGDFKNYLDAARSVAAAIDSSVIRGSNDQATPTSVGVRVRNSAGGTDKQQNRSLGATGTILNGPTRAQVGGSGEWYIWWNIQWSDGVSGWSAEENLKRTNSSPLDTTKPTFASLSVSNSSIAQGASVTISFSVSDSGGSGLSTAQLWRTTDSGGSPDPNNWTQVGSNKSLSGNGPTTGNFVDTPANGVFWYGLHVSDVAGNFATEADSGFSPVKVTVAAPTLPSKVTNPSPAFAAVGTPVALVLQWANGGNATSYDVYFGTDPTPDNGELEGGQSGSSFNPPTLAYSTTYYWRIDARNGNGLTTGDVWSFTTMAAPTTKVVSVTGIMDFGSVPVGTSAGAALVISNTGNSALTVSGITYPIGFSGNWSAGTISANSSKSISVTFSPSAATSYGGTITVACDKTSGTNTIQCSGLGSVALTPLETWRQTHFGSSANSGDGADENDFDGDGIPNLVEFAFGLDPKQNSAGTLPQPHKSGSNFVANFTQPAGVTGVTITAEWSETFAPGSWTAIPNSGTFPQHTYSVPTGSHAKLFMRFKVTNS